MTERIINAVTAMGAKVSREQAEKIYAYHNMLKAANREMNLTRVDEDDAEAADRNYIDSLTALTHIGNAETIIDVGSGAGLPGIPLSIVLPNVRFTLLDALKKRVEFLKSVIQALGLNAVAVHGRSEDMARSADYRDAFDIAVARAVAETRVLCEFMLPFVKPDGFMLALKGPLAEEEAKAADSAMTQLNARLEGIYNADIPHRDWNHKLVKIQKLAPTPDKFPRRAGMAEKRPL